MNAAVTRRVAYRGPARGAHVLVGLLRDQGVEVQWQPPVEARSFTGDAHAVALTIVSTGAVEAIKSGVRLFRERFGEREASVAIKGEGEGTDG